MRCSGTDHACLYVSDFGLLRLGAAGGSIGAADLSGLTFVVVAGVQVGGGRRDRI